ncbi:hypothetical protein GLOIN_2v1485349 [Rhizophagus irregularis DAOM 181602=DAOM 197198]|nr:hypothetical protein GLOIN_2v1485349 [Rhizophagus irregularis DAOM 181602=DAOM 197198]
MSGPAARTRSQVTSQGQADIQVSLPQEKQNDNKQPIQVNNNTTVLTTNDMIDCSHDAAAGSHKDKRKNNNKQGFSVEQALLGPSSSPSLTSNIALESQQTKADQSENPSQQQTKVTQSNVSAQQQINKPPETSQPNMASTTEGPEITDISMQDADHDSQGSTEEEILYYAKKQQTFSLFIGVKLSDKVNTSFATNFLKNTRDFLISDSNLGPGISQVSKIIPDFNKVAPGEGSRDNNNEANQDKPIKKKKDIIGYHLIINVTTKEIYESIMAVDFSCAEDTVSFAPYQSIRTQRKQTNEGTRGRTVQIYNASLEITTATLKPFLRRYGELEENGVYATRRNPYQPNKQIFYATYKESASADTFYGKPILWVYNEMLYITPMELSLDKREERRAFCAKLNGLPPNANAREYQDFIEEFNVLEFRIPRNTRTNRTQLYAYVYFKDEESMQRGTDRVIMRRNKQHEWSIPDMKSCFNCGYTSHLISDCDYRPPRNRPMNKKDYLNSVRRYQPGYRQREKQENARPGSYADAIRSRPNEARFENRKFQERYRQDNPYSNNKDRPWNRNNLRKRNDDNHNYGDDEQGMHEWDEEDDSFEDIPRSSSRASVLSRPRNAHYENVDRTPRNHRDDNEIQSIKQDLATLQDIVKTLAKSLEQTTNQISLYMQTTSSKGKEKVNEMNNNAMLIDQSGNTDNRQHQTPKRRLVSFNENNKRPQREDSSDSDSNDNRQNNMALLTAQLQELHKGMENITSSLTNINNRITTVDIARQVPNRSVATLNIRQLNDIKAQNLAKYLDKNDIDILSITETRISNKNLKFITKNKFMNHQVFGTVGAKFNESGTLVIVKKELAKHISKLENYKGRILKIEFTFSDQQKLAIISVYNKSGDRGKDCVETRIDINKEIMKMIKDSKKKNQQIILMGDFNLQYKKYLQQKNSNRTRISEQLKIFDLLEKSELFDTCKEILNIDDLALTKNHVTHITKKLGSRIDYIWVTKKIFDEIVQVQIKEYDNKNDTDHKIVYFKVARDCVLPSIIYNRKKKSKFDKRTKYCYDTIDEEIKECIKMKAEYELNERKNRSSTMILTLHEKIQLYEDVINATKNSEIEKKEICLTNEKEDTSIKNLDLYRAVRFFIYLRRKLKKKKGIENVKRHWKKNISHVNKILKNWDVDGFYYLRSYNFGKVQIKKYITELDELYNIFQTKLQIKVSAMKENKIKRAIEQRQKDLEDNQKRMIDNVMDREFRKINIDRVLSTNSKGEDILIVDEDKIKEKVADHFQNCAGTISIDKELPEDWKEEYNSGTHIHIPSFAYDKVLEKISIEEILEAAKELPQGKASGPSGITYEDIKLTILPLKEYIQEIFNDILETEEIPKQWLKANIYPIPKPKPWGYDLNNTRPITLLETLRKMFMKIITNRLSDAMVKYNILRGHQFAGLPKKSTFEPLRIIKELIDYANEENKELWFFLVDMSKAYDRVNIYMLRKAMKRIKIPEKLCNIIIGMFQGRMNQVFTPFGLTKPFEMMTGIDQGEIISPLLWIIFYDPLLDRLRKSDLGFKISAKEQLDIYEGLTREKQIRFPACGYMDDTSFLTNNKLDMERILKIADSFYMLNDIKINKKKSALLIRFKEKKRLNNEINLQFGNKEIGIQPVQHNGSERFLGVWINMYNKNKHIQQQVKNEVMSINKAFTTKKGLTDKMMIYLFNYLIIPIVKYRTQLTVMDGKVLEKLMSPFRKILKNKLKMACTAPNAILETNYIYNLNSFTNNQLQAKITNFILQINDKGILGEIMDI